MKLTFQQYIDNPLGKKNAAFSQRDLFRHLYSEKFDKIIVREAGKIDYRLFYDKPNDQFYILMKIPSEMVPKFYYEVVIQFYTDNNGLRTDKTLNDYYVKFFSNDPAFVFTYLRVFRKNDMFVEAMKERAPRLALNKDPKEKNPFEIPGYVKSIYFAFLYMKTHSLFLKTNFDMYGSKYDKSTLLKLVEPADDKITKREAEGEKVRKEKLATSKAKENQARGDYISKINRANANSPNKRIATMGNVHKISPIKPSIKNNSSINIIGRKK